MSLISFSVSKQWRSPSTPTTFILSTTFNMFIGEFIGKSQWWNDLFTRVSIWASFIALAAFYALIIKVYEAKAYSFSFSLNIIFIAISFGLVFIYRVILKANKFSKLHYPKVLVGVGSGLIALGLNIANNPYQL